jgi:alpha-1,2-mannosyltransferase
VRYGFWLGQTTSLIFLLVVGALALQRRGQHAAAGVALAIAAFVKLTPVVLALPWLWRGPRRAFAWFCAAGAALWGLSLAVAGWGLHAQYVARVRAIGASVLAAYNNQSLPAFVTRFTLPADAAREWRIYPLPPVATIVTLAVVGAIVAAMALLLARSRDEARWRPLAEATAFVVILLAPTIAWTHYFVALLPVFAALVAARRALWLPVAAAAALLCRPLVPSQNHWPGRGPLALSLPTLAALLGAALVVVAAMMLRTCSARPRT